MAQQTLNLGTGANTGDGDTLRAAGQKINENFTELYGYAAYSYVGSDLTLYVATTGSDSNNGLTVGTPFLTIQKAVNVVSRFWIDAGATVTIQLADGTYTENIVLRPFGGPGAAVVQGNSGTPANVIVTSTTGNTLYFSQQGYYILRHFEVRSTAGAGFYAQNGAVISFTNIRFGTCGLQQARAEYGATISASGNYSIVGGAQIHAYTVFAATFTASGRTITLTGTPAFSTAFASANVNANTSFTSCTFSGSATGARYSAYALGCVHTATANANFLPGNAAGSTSNGGVYT